MAAPELLEKYRRVHAQIKARDAARFAQAPEPPPFSEFVDFVASAKGESLGTILGEPRIDAGVKAFVKRHIILEP